MTPNVDDGLPQPKRSGDGFWTIPRLLGLLAALIVAHLGASAAYSAGFLSTPLFGAWAMAMNLGQAAIFLPITLRLYRHYKKLRSGGP
ncbi:hypothetical protein M9M90_20400 [Phenylobacterium sp. LH3H17]|uniref:hypothetical protein n=1 Tax=Phenylobacterium sp. LH3H17 TaxID=2903901 RepID=UPI0020C99802|nr:hypothetical protein [Phenylobacterium sp. LH3H17]UTP39539.1 hypothetical protein M9M90_20400 [Phenylobacterium sp. LH3H17]